MSFVCPSKKSGQNAVSKKAVSVSAEHLSEVSVASGDELVMASTISISECQSTKEDVLLLYREVVVSNVEHPEQKETVLLFFDPDSQKSYIDEQLGEH